MTIPYIRGWVGVFIFCLGVIMAFFEQTKSLALFPMSFGAGMAAAGFKVP